MKTIIYVECIDQELIIVDSPVIASGGSHENYVSFKFCNKWDGFGKTAVFYRNESEKYYSVVGVDGMCEIPSEVTASEGTMYFGVFGESDNATRTSNTLKYKIKRSAMELAEPTPDVYQQLVSAYGKTNEAIAKEVHERKVEVAVERARIDQLSKLEEGSTTGDAELMDIRVGADGTSYETAGDAVREQIGQLSSEIDNFFNMYQTSDLVLKTKLTHMDYGMFSVEGNIYQNISDRITTFFKVDTPVVIKANEGHLFHIFKTYANSYTDANNDNTTKMTNTWSESFCINEHGLYMISYKKVDGNSFEVSECTNFQLMYYYLKDDSTVEYTVRNDIAVGCRNNKYYAYESSGNTKTVIVELQKGEEIKYTFKNMNRCRIVAFNKLFEDITLVVTHDNPEEVADKVIFYDDTRTEITGIYKAINDVEAVIFYIGVDVSSDIEILLLKHQTMSDSISIKAENISYDMPTPEFIAEFDNFDNDYSADASDFRKQSTTQEEFYDLFYNPYLGFSKNGAYRVTKKILGKDQSETYDVFEYDFCPKNYSKTILLTSGLHAYETPASFGLAMWIRDLMSEKNETFKWIKENVRVKVIPIANPWGFNQYPKKYGNVNGVNPNRNFNDWNNSWESFPTYSSDPSDPNYNEWNVKGSEPFSESETQIIAEWLNANKEAVFWIDCHTGFGHSKGENWIIYQSTNPYVGKIRFALQLLEKRIAEKYGTTPQSTVQINLETSIKIKYSNDVVGIPCMVIEQCGKTNSYGTNVNNEPILITEYATTINAYVVAQLMID